MELSTHSHRIYSMAYVAYAPGDMSTGRVDWPVIPGHPPTILFLNGSSGRRRPLLLGSFWPIGWLPVRSRALVWWRREIRVKIIPEIKK